MKINQITIGQRHRRDLGDIAALAASMASPVGLLHPVIVNSALELIAGERRLAAARSLGWTEIEVRVLDNLDDIAAALQAEHDENSHRKAFTPSEAADMAKALEPYQRKAAKERQTSGKNQYSEPSVKFTEPSKGDSRDKVAEAVGMSAPTLAKAKAVVEAAEQHPEEYGDLQKEMDDTGKVSPAYNKLVERQSTGAPKTHTPHKPTRIDRHEADTEPSDDVSAFRLESEPSKPQFTKHKPSGGEVWAKWISECARVLVNTRDAGGIENLMASWAPGEAEEYLDAMYSFRDAAQGWIDYLETVCHQKQAV